MWKFEFDAPVGLRCMSNFWAITTLRKGNLDIESMWWSHDEKKWMSSDTVKGAHSTHCQGPKTFKAFKRYLRKHPELQVVGLDVVFVNRCSYTDTDLNITARWENK